MASGPVATGPDALIPYRWQAGCDRKDLVWWGCSWVRVLQDRSVPRLTSPFPATIVIESGISCGAYRTGRENGRQVNGEPPLDL